MTNQIEFNRGVGFGGVSPWSLKQHGKHMGLAGRSYKCK